MQRQSVRNLPTNKNPTGTRCIQITIPDDDEWERALYGEVFRLTRWNLWERDLGKFGKPVADRWLEAIWTWTHCNGTPPPPGIGGIMEDFAMPLRVDCDCNVFVTCCDGTEKQILTADQVAQLVNGAPGAGKTPPPAGGCQNYMVAIPAGKAWFAPFLLNTGDVLTPTNLQGASTDVAPLGRWNCAEGLQFVGGICTGFEDFDPSSPRPDLPIGIPLLQIGSTYYDARSPITVGGGFSAAPGAFVLNYSSGGNYAGTVTLALQFCNNQAGTYSHLFDFRDAPYWTLTPGLANGPYGEWIPGNGWAGTDGFLNGLYRRNINLQLFHPAAHITGGVATVYFSIGEDALSTENSQSWQLSNGAYQFQNDMAHAVSGNPALLSGSIDASGITSQQLILQNNSDASGTGGFSGALILRNLTINGIGADPF